MTHQPKVLGVLARTIVRERDKIGSYLDASLFADPALDILLDLFACEAEGQQVSMSSCSIAARVPRTTALRWVRLLEQKDLVQRYRDATDQRLTLLRLTERARPALVGYLEQIAQSPIRC